MILTLINNFKRHTLKTLETYTQDDGSKHKRRRSMIKFERSMLIIKRQNPW